MTNCIKFSEHVNSRLPLPSQHALKAAIKLKMERYSILLNFTNSSSSIEEFLAQLIFNVFVYIFGDTLYV